MFLDYARSLRYSLCRLLRILLASSPSRSHTAGPGVRAFIFLLDDGKQTLFIQEQPNSQVSMHYFAVNYYLKRTTSVRHELCATVKMSYQSLAGKKDQGLKETLLAPKLYTLE